MHFRCTGLLAVSENHRHVSASGPLQHPIVNHQKKVTSHPPSCLSWHLHQMTYYILLIFLLSIICLPPLKCKLHEVFLSFLFIVISPKQAQWLACSRLLINTCWMNWIHCGPAVTRGARENVEMNRSSSPPPRNSQSNASDKQLYCQAEWKDS